MFEEEQISAGPRTLGENLVMWHICALGVLTAWFFGGNIDWAPGFLISAALLSPFLFGMHRKRGDFRRSGELRRYMGYWLILIILVATYVSGIFFPVFREITLQGQTYLQFQQPDWWLPVNPRWESGLWSILLHFSLFIAALNIRFIVGERWVLRRILIVLSLNAATLALLGFVHWLFDAQYLYGFVRPPNPDFFAAFIHPHHWSAFAYLWLVGSIGLVAFYKQRRSWLSFAKSYGSIAAGAVLVLAISIYAVGVPFYTIATSLFLGAGLLVIGLESLLKGRRKAGSLILSGLVAAGALALLAWGGIRAVDGVKEWRANLTAHQLETRAGNTDELTPSDKPAVFEDTWDLFMERPLFGWGSDSFTLVFPLYREADLTTGIISHPQSSFLLALAETGIVGAGVWGLALIALLAGLRGCRPAGVSGFVLAGLLPVILFGAWDFPFANPAFVVSFWILLATGIRWAQTKPT